MNDGMFEDFEKKLEADINNIPESEKVIDDIKEREWRWKQKRIGKITSSNLDSLMSLKKNGKMSEKGINYLLEIIHQRQTGCDSEEISAKAFDWGHSHEEEALEYYNRMMNMNASSGTSGFDEIIFKEPLEGFGDSPDGITEDGEGIVEIKCPINGANHLKMFGVEEYHDGLDYFWQCIGHMIDPKVKWVDLVFFDPRYKDEDHFKMRVFHIEKKKVQSCVDSAISHIKYWNELMNENDIIKFLEEI